MCGSFTIREGAEQRISKARRTGLLLVIVSGVFSIICGIFLSRAVSNGGLPDFQNIYFGTECLLHHCDPYNVTQLDDFYKERGIDNLYKKPGLEDPAEIKRVRQLATLYVNLPTTFLFITPFTILGWGPAHVLWMILSVSAFVLAAILMWDIGARYSPGVAALLICSVLANSEIVFANGNTAGLVVGLSVIAVWCFLEKWFVPAGMLCFIAALAIKPHDAGLVWLYFLLAGGIYRKRALQVLVIVAVLGLAAFMWLSHAIPHWLPEMHANLATISGSGGLNNPGPGSMTGTTAIMVIDLQAALSIFWNNSRFYNLTSYFVCGTMLVLWSIATLRSRFSTEKSWLALAAVVPLTLLATYHRPYDARLLLLSVPACAMLWAKGGKIARVAVLLTTAGIVLTGDIPLAISIILAKKLLSSTSGLPKLIMALLFTRPASLVLLAMAIFYLWVYWNYARSASTASSGESQPISLDVNQTTG